MAREIVVATLSAMSSSSDTILFHEALGQVFDTLATAEIEALLAPRGVVFVNYVPPAPVQAGAASRAVAQAADAWDFATGGGYRVALFGRGDAAGGRVEHPGLVWSTVLQPAPANDGVARFVDPASGAGIQTDEWAMQAVIECLIAAPRDWAGLGAAVLVWLSLRGLPAPDADAFDAAAAGLLATLWGARLARPVLREVE